MSKKNPGRNEVKKKLLPAPRLQPVKVIMTYPLQCTNILITYRLNLLAIRGKKKIC